jgi:hypothetical protein
MLISLPAASGGREKAAACGVHVLSAMIAILPFVMRGLDPRIHAGLPLARGPMDCRVKPGNDESVCGEVMLNNSPPIQLSNSHASSPVLFVRRRVRLQLRAPQNMRGGGAPSGAPALCSRLDRSAGAQTNPGVLRPLIKDARLSALHRGVLFGSGPRFSVGMPHPSASSSQPGLSARRAVPRSRPSAQSHVSPAPAGAASDSRRGFSGKNLRKPARSLPGPPSARSASERLRRRPSRARTVRTILSEEYCQENKFCDASVWKGQVDGAKRRTLNQEGQDLHALL